MSKLQLIATSAFGIEAVAARELKWLGYDDQQVETGRITFAGDEEAICRTNIWLRTADRVLLKMGEFTALTFDELFEGTRALPWDEWLPGDAQFPVDGKSVSSKLASVPDCQAIVKKAIVEKMKQRYKKQWFEESGPLYRIEVSLLKDRATLTVDTSGPGLHKRGYRDLVSEAPLKETLASALLLISRWKTGRELIDPFCGSGTIPVEAAMIAANIAPGAKRSFSAEGWPQVPDGLWNRVREEAADKARLADEPGFGDEISIHGSDIDDGVLRLARRHAERAGVSQFIHFQRRDFSEISSKHKYGFIITNPPYGERIGEIPEVERLYREMGRAFKKLDTWSFYILTSHPRFEALFGRKADKRRKLYNGRIQCNYYQFFGPPPPRPVREEGPGDEQEQG
jgi:putative N6-adenine-specific DNA methylase